MIESTEIKTRRQFLMLLGATAVGAMGCGYGSAELPQSDIVMPQAEGNQQSDGKADLVLAHSIKSEQELRIIAHTPYLILDSIRFRDRPTRTRCWIGFRFMLRTVKGAQFTLMLLDKDGKTVECKTNREDVGPDGITIPGNSASFGRFWHEERSVSIDFPPDIIKKVASFKLEVTHY